MLRGEAMNMGERIQCLLDEKNMTQRELAQQLHLAPNTVNGYIKNYRSPDCATIVSLASNLDTSSDYLLGLSGSTLPIPTGITPEERRILIWYRHLDDSGKQFFLELASSFR